MKHFTYIAVYTLFVYTLGENCDKSGILLYEDLACKPLKSEDLCPTSYDCKNLDAPNKCVVQGKTYTSGDPIEKNSIGFSCEFGCFCNTLRNESRVSCVQFGCSEWSGLPPSPGCYRKYDLEACCSRGEICPPFTDNTKCLVDGVEYKAGERFVPKDSCHVCLCQKGFNGKIEAPFCKRSGCDAQLHNQKEVQKYCAPVYVKREGDGDKLCCPQHWACEDGTEVIKSSGQKSEVMCRFGQQILQIGDTLEKDSVVNFPRSFKVKCECKIPPLLTCQER